jgi:hypothetical protein
MDPCLLFEALAAQPHRLAAQPHMQIPAILHHPLPCIYSIFTPQNDPSWHPCLVGTF